MKLKVKYAKLQTEYFSVGAGNLGTTLDANKFTGMEMYYTENGLMVKYRGAHFLVPPANIVGATFVEDPFVVKVADAA